MRNKETGTFFDLRCGAVPTFTNPEQYVKQKLKMLKNHMCIEPTLEEINHLYSLKTEGDIDRAVHSIIERHWA